MDFIELLTLCTLHTFLQKPLTVSFISSNLSAKSGKRISLDVHLESVFMNYESCCMLDSSLEVSTQPIYVYITVISRPHNLTPKISLKSKGQFCKY